MSREYPGVIVNDRSGDGASAYAGAISEKRDHYAVGVTLPPRNHPHRDVSVTFGLDELIQFRDGLNKVLESALSENSARGNRRLWDRIHTEF